MIYDTSVEIVLTFPYLGTMSNSRGNYIYIYIIFVIDLLKIKMVTVN